MKFASDLAMKYEKILSKRIFYCCQEKMIIKISKELKGSTSCMLGCNYIMIGNKFKKIPQEKCNSRTSDEF